MARFSGGGLACQPHDDTPCSLPYANTRPAADLTEPRRREKRPDAMNHSREDRFRNRKLRPLFAAAVAVIILTGLAFSPVVRNGFVLIDDDKYLGENEVVMRGLTLEGIHLVFTSSYAANWHPLTWISHMVDVELFGLDPRGHHLTSLAIHAAAAALLLLTLWALTARAGPAFAVAALFATHPLRVESVVWAAERKDVLSGLLFFASLLAWVRYTRRPHPGRYVLATLLFALALMAKPMVITLPLVLLFLDWWPLGRLRAVGPAGSTPSALRRFAVFPFLEKLPFVALSLASAYLTLRAQAAGGAIVKLEDISFSARVANALLSYVNYLGMSAFPFGLANDYPHLKPDILDLRVVAAGIALLAASAGTWLLRRRQPWLITGWGWFLIMLVPVIGLVQVGDQARADRYTYLPLIGIVLALCWSLAALSSSRPARVHALRALTAAALAICIILTMRQVTFWRDSETLFNHTLRIARNSWKAANNLGVVRESDGRQDEAMHLYREAARMKPTAAIPRHNIAKLLMLQGKTDEALEAFRAAVRAEPDPLSRMHLALLLEQQGLDEEATSQLRELIRETPQMAAAYNNLAALLVRGGELTEARRLLRTALQIDPAYADARANLQLLDGESTSSSAPGGAPPDISTTGLSDHPPRGLPAE